MAVEGEGADVGLFVLLLFGEALLEVALLLEAALLGHLALLLVGLHDASLAAEDLHLAVEHLVFAQLALQRAVVEGNLDAGLQSYLLEALLAVAQYPCVAPRELVLQPLANHAIGVEQVGRGDALAVGRVGDDDGFLLRLGEVLEVLLLDGDAIAESCRLHILAGGVHGLEIHVVAVDVVAELALLRVVVVNLVEQLCVEVGPFLEGIFLSEEAGGHVSGDEGGLDEQSAAAAHGVDEVGVALPARHHNDAGGEHLVEWCLHALLTVASAVQTFAAAVETERAVVLGDVDVQAQVGVGDADVRPLARSLAQLVDDGVLHLVADELGMAEILAEHHAVDSEGLVVGEVLAPVNLLDGFVNFVGAAGFEMVDGLQDFDGRVQLEVSSVHQFLVACKRHHASAYLYVVGPQLSQLFRQDGLQSHEGFGNELKILFH